MGSNATLMALPRLLKNRWRLKEGFLLGELTKTKKSGRAKVQYAALKGTNRPPQRAYYDCFINSTRRFSARPASVALLETGSLAPLASTDNRL